MLVCTELGGELMRRRLMLLIEEEEMSKNVIVQKVATGILNTGAGLRFRVQNPKPGIEPKVIGIMPNEEAVVDSKVNNSMLSINKSIYIYAGTAYENNGNFNEASDVTARTCRFKDDYFEFSPNLYMAINFSHIYIIWIYDSDETIELEKY